MMRIGMGLACLALAACNGGGAPAGPASFDIAALKASEEHATVTGWYQASESYRAFRLYPVAGDFKAKANCISGIASSLAGVPADTLNGKKVTIEGYLYAAGSPDIGDTPNDCGAAVMLLANDIVYAD